MTSEDRVRLNVTFTAKDGWRLNDITVEVSSQSADSEMAREHRNQLLVQAFHDGQQIVDWKNNPAGNDMPDHVPGL